MFISSSPCIQGKKIAPNTVSVYTKEKIKWFSFCKFVQPWSVICQHSGGWSSLGRTGCFQGTEQDVTGHWRMIPFPFEIKLNLRSQVWIWLGARRYHILDEKLMSKLLMASRDLLGTTLKEMIFPCLNCFGIRHCRCSVRLRFSFPANLCSALVWKIEYIFPFFLIPITY